MLPDGSLGSAVRPIRTPAGDDACRDEPSDLALRRGHAALAFRGFYGGEGGESFTTVVRAHFRRGVRREVDRLGSDDEFSPSVHRLLVSRRGTVAYSAGSVDEGSGEVSVIGRFLAGRRGVPSRHRRLDEGPDVRSQSLAVRARRLVWTSGSEERSAAWR